MIIASYILMVRHLARADWASTLLSVRKLLYFCDPPTAMRPQKFPLSCLNNPGVSVFFNPRINFDMCP